MKITVLSGAYKNAGDFLIVNRCLALLKGQFSKCTINVLERDKSLNDKLELLNTSDAIILAGGPFYMPDIYPDRIPLVEDLSTIKTKIFALGGGWCGSNDSVDYLCKQYVFSNSTRKLLERIESDFHYLSCRDWYSAWVLNANGIKGTMMTGCPAWYDLRYIGESHINNNIHIPFRKVCISDPANVKNVQQALSLSRFIRDRYKNAEIHYIFHRGDAVHNGKNNAAIEEFKEELEKLSINILNIEGSEDGFAIYDDCDLHIGYRVHAHIYNLSRRNISVLIEEDGRGAGINHCLGLERIKAYKNNNYRVLGDSLKHKVQRKIENKLFGIGNYQNNEFVIWEVKTYLERLESSKFAPFEIAFSNMNSTYLQMKEYLSYIERCIGE